MIELVYVAITSLQKSRSTDSPRIEALGGVWIILSPVFYSILAIILPFFGVEIQQGNLRNSPVYWGGMLIALLVAWLAFDRRRDTIKAKYSNLQVPESFAKRMWWLLLLLTSALALVFLAARLPIACLVAFSILELSIRSSSRRLLNPDRE